MNYLKRFSIKFYKTKTWQDKRDEILQRDNYECQMCKDKGRYTSATTVHHIQHYKDCPELALTNSNLISLCDACHNVVHPEKLESVHKKKKFIKKNGNNSPTKIKMIFFYDYRTVSGHCYVRK
jgi:gp54 protein|nr:MAG TPA: NinG recombination protein [Caudoviricetes sp.]